MDFDKVVKKWAAQKLREHKGWRDDHPEFEVTSVVMETSDPGCPTCGSGSDNGVEVTYKLNGADWFRTVTVIPEWAFDFATTLKELLEVADGME